MPRQSKLDQYALFDRSIGKNIELITKSGLEKIAKVLSYTTKYLYCQIDGMNRHFKLMDIFVYEIMEQTPQLDDRDFETSQYSPLQIPQSKFLDIAHDSDPELTNLSSESDNDEPVTLVSSGHNSPIDFDQSEPFQAPHSPISTPLPFDDPLDNPQDLTNFGVDEPINIHLQLFIKTDTEDQIFQTCMDKEELGCRTPIVDVDDNWEFVRIPNQNPLDQELCYPNVYEIEENDVTHYETKMTKEELDQELEQYKINAFKEKIKKLCQEYNVLTPQLDYTNTTLEEYKSNVEQDYHNIFQKFKENLDLQINIFQDMLQLVQKYGEVQASFGFRRDLCDKIKEMMISLERLNLQNPF